MERAKESMFQRVRDVEVIQGLVRQSFSHLMLIVIYAEQLLISAWSESTSGTCWIVTGMLVQSNIQFYSILGYSYRSCNPMRFRDGNSQSIIKVGFRST